MQNVIEQAVELEVIELEEQAYSCCGYYQL